MRRKRKEGGLVEKKREAEKPEEGISARGRPFGNLVDLMIPRTRERENGQDSIAERILRGEGGDARELRNGKRTTRKARPGKTRVIFS